MTVTSLSAHAAAGQWDGSAMARDGAPRHLGELLRRHGLMAAGEIIVDVHACVDDDRGGEVQEPNVTVQLASAADCMRGMVAAAADAALTRQVGLHLRPLEFLSLFERLSIALHRPRLDRLARPPPADGQAAPTPQGAAPALHAPHHLSSAGAGRSARQP